jgi:nitric oxide synthase oxygenase domain/subunit
VLDLDLQNDGHEEAAAEYDGWYLQTQMTDQRGEEKRRAKVVILISALPPASHPKDSLKKGRKYKQMKELTIAFEYSFILKSLVT